MSSSLQQTRSGRGFIGRLQDFLAGLSQGQVSVLVFFGYLLMAALVTWPVIIELGASVPSIRQGDQWEHQWTFWWIKEALSTGANPFYTTKIFYPEGISLVSHNIAWINALVWLPLQAIVGSLAAVSLIYIAMFALNGLSMYLLVHELVGQRSAAIIGGLIFAFWPYTLSQAGHPNMIVLFWLPFALLFLERTLIKGRVRDAVLTGVFLAIGGIARWQLLIIGGMLFGFYLLYRLLAEPRCRSKKTMRLLFLAGFVCLLLMAPFAFPIVEQLINGVQAVELYREIGRPADILAYFVPSLRLSTWGSLVKSLPERLLFNHDQMEFLGLTTLALAIYGTLKNWRSSRFWVFIGLFFILLALGPTLRAGSQDYPQVSLPFRWVEELFLIRIQRAPHRFNAFLGLPMAMLAAWGVVTLRQRVRAMPSFRDIFRAENSHRKPHSDRQRAQRNSLWFAVVIALAVLILLEYAQVPYPTSSAPLPTWYEQLAGEPGDFAVLVLPMDQRAVNKLYMQYQTYHGKALVQGEISRVPSDALAFVDDSQFLSRLRDDNIMDPELADVSRQIQQLARANIRYLILDKRFAESAQLEQWRGWLTYEPIYEDEELVVYHTDPRLGRDFDIGYELSDHLGLIKTDYGPKKLSQGGLLWVTARWTSDGRPVGDYQACVELHQDSGQVVDSDCATLPETWPTSQWDVDEIVLGDTILQPGPFDEPGGYSLTLSLVDVETKDRIGRAIDLGSVEIEALPRTYDIPDLDHTIDAQWGEEITLLGFHLEESAESLAVNLYWQALERPTASYKVFVHLINQSTGELAAQADTLPRGWTYPTNWWDRGEVISDTINLPVTGLPSGQYQLSVGLYDAETGERLTVATAEGQPHPENAVSLTILER